MLLLVTAVWVGIVSLFAVCVTVYDKRAAMAHQWRVPEATLLLLAAIGGAAAMLITMRTIHHKTRKPKFMVGLPVILVLQAIFVLIPAAVISVICPL